MKSSTDDVIAAYAQCGYLYNPESTGDSAFYPSPGFSLRTRVTWLYRTFKIGKTEFQRLYRLTFADNESRDLVQVILKQKYKI